MELSMIPSDRRGAAGEHSGDTAADGKGVSGVPENIRGAGQVIPVVPADGIHHVGTGASFHNGPIPQKGKEILLKRVFIFFMLPQIRGETGVVGVCKRVHGIVDQLPGGVIV